MIRDHAGGKPEERSDCGSGIGGFSPGEKGKYTDAPKHRKAGYRLSKQIARRAGIQQPGLYNYFSSTEALYAAVLDRALVPMADAMDLHMRSTAPAEIQATLSGVMTDLLLEHPQMSGLFQRALQGDPDSTGNRLIKGWLERLFTQAIEGLGALNESEGDRVDMALETIAMFNLTTGYFQSQRIFETLVGGDLTDPAIIARQKALLERLARAARRD